MSIFKRRARLGSENGDPSANDPRSPLITTHQPDWLSQIALKHDRDPFEHLGTLSELGLHEEVRKRFGEFGISHEVVERALADPAPIPATKDREHYFGDRHADFWMSGASDAQHILEAACAFPDIDPAGGRFLELGCASGRVLRHIHTLTDMRCFGCDLNLRHVEWMRMFLDHSVTPFQNSILPNLPLPDNHFDIVAAFSVFTHIDDFETAWLMELKRILKPGGMAYLTVSTDATWESYKQGWIKDSLLPMRDQITEFDITEHLFEGPLPREKTVFWWASLNVYNCTVYHAESYLRREWSRHFEIVDVVREGHTYQDVFVLRKVD
jgi:SAM-dependent methyltransferase